MTTASGVTVTVHASASVADFRAPILFSATVAGTAPFVYVWEFGDGATSPDAAPSHAYQSSGTETVWLHVIDATGTVGWGSTVVTVNPQVVVQVAPVVQTVAVGEAYQFEVNVTGGTAPYTYFWQFGDGSSSPTATPQHAYAFPGLYTATLWVNDSTGLVTPATVQLFVPFPNATASSPGSSSAVTAYEIIGVAAVLAIFVIALGLARRT